MRDTIIHNDTYLGPHPASLQVGDTQHMQFQPGDVGPFWMTAEERIQNMNDHESDIVQIKNTQKRN